MVALPLGVPGEPRSGHAGGVLARGGGSGHPTPPAPRAHPPNPTQPTAPQPALALPGAAPALAGTLWGACLSFPALERGGARVVLGRLRHSRVGAEHPVPAARGLQPLRSAQNPNLGGCAELGILSPGVSRDGQNTGSEMCRPPPVGAAAVFGTCCRGVCSAGSLGSSCCRRRCRAGGGPSPGHAGTTRLAGWHRSPVRGAGRRPSSHLLERDPAHQPRALGTPPLGAPPAPAAAGLDTPRATLDASPRGHPRGHPRCALRPTTACLA